MEGPARRISQRGQPRQPRDLAARAQQNRRHVQQQLVDEPGAQQRAVELVARFHVQLVDAAPGEVAQHGCQIHLAAFAWQEGELGAGCPKQGGARGVVVGGVDEHPAWGGEQLRVRGSLQGRVHHDAQRLVLGG